MDLNSITSILAEFSPSDLVIASSAVALAGLVRGFSGFGAAMIAIPLISLLYDPQTALAALTAMGVPAQIQLWRMTGKDMDWRQATPMAMASLLTVPAGTWILVSVDQEVLRQAISVLVLILVALLASGYRHRVDRGIAPDIGVGAVAGFLNGSAGLGGPPIIFYLLSGPQQAASVRANINAFFMISFVFVAATYAWFGVLTLERVLLGIVLTPAYLIGIAAGGRLFDVASERTFRRIAFGLLAMIGAGTLLL